MALRPTHTFCSLREPGFLLQGHNWQNQPDFGWFLLGHSLLTSSEMPWVRSPGVLRWVVVAVGRGWQWAEGAHLGSPGGPLRYPSSSVTVGLLRTLGLLLGPADFWFDIRLGVGSVRDNPAQAAAGLCKINS